MKWLWTPSLSLGYLFWNSGMFYHRFPPSPFAARASHKSIVCAVLELQCLLELCWEEPCPPTPNLKVSLLFLCFLSPCRSWESFSSYPRSLFSCFINNFMLGLCFCPSCWFNFKCCLVVIILNDFMQLLGLLLFHRVFIK